MAFEAANEEVTAARAYETLHVPALFGRWAPFVSAAAGIGPGQRVLDVACGTGVLARHVASLVGDHGRVVGLDVDGGMLAVAEELAPSIEWCQAAAESLPFEEASFDAVVSQFGLMFFPDRTAALQEMLRVLVPGGRLAVSVWESLERSEAYPLEVALLNRLAGEAAAEALRAPFVLGDRDELERLFAGAGVESPSIETRHVTARFPSIRSMVEADLRGWLPVMGVALEEALIQTVLSEAESVLSGFETRDGAIEFDAPAHVISARKAAS